MFDGKYLSSKVSVDIHVLVFSELQIFATKISVLWLLQPKEISPFSQKYEEAQSHSRNHRQLLTDKHEQELLCIAKELSFGSLFVDVKQIPY
jgi:hypothetical protein